MCLENIKRSHLFLLDGEEKLELIGEFFFRIETVREVDSSNSAVSMNLYSQSLNVTGTVRSAGEIGQVKLDLVPAFIQSHRHSTDEGLHTSGALSQKIT